jgi:hypothetical protein
MRADEHDLRCACAARNRDLEIRRFDPLRQIGLARDGVSEPGELAGNESFRRAQRRGPPDVPLADLAGEPLDVPSEPGFERCGHA